MTVKTAELKKALGLVDGVLPGNTNIVITSGIWFLFGEDFLNLITTDLENTLRAQAESVSDGKGEFVINGKRLVAVVSKTGEDEIVFNIKEGEVELSAGNSKYKFLTMNPEDFPRVPAVEKGIELQLDAGKFIDCLKSVSFCIDIDEPRPHFRGVLVDITKTGINFVGTDTKQLALNYMEYVSETPAKVLLPIKMVNILQKSLGTGNMEIVIAKNNIFLKQGEFEMTSQLLSGSDDFPDFSKVIPDSKKLEFAEIPAAVLKNSLNKLSAFLTDRYQKIMFEFGRDKLNLLHQNPETGEVKDGIDIKFAGDVVTVALNPAINGFLGRFNDKSLSLGVKDNKGPLLLTGEDKNYRYIVMPLKID
ncbi:MAG: DNA polymerase III subunit beta [Patescibacteria group bacterium]